MFRRLDWPVISTSGGRGLKSGELSVFSSLSKYQTNCWKLTLQYHGRNMQYINVSLKLHWVQPWLTSPAAPDAVGKCCYRKSNCVTELQSILLTGYFLHTGDPFIIVPSHKETKKVRTRTTDLISLFPLRSSWRGCGINLPCPEGRIECTS